MFFDLQALRCRWLCFSDSAIVFSLQQRQLVGTLIERIENLSSHPLPLQAAKHKQSHAGFQKNQGECNALRRVTGCRQQYPSNCIWFTNSDSFQCREKKVLPTTSIYASLSDSNSSNVNVNLYLFIVHYLFKIIYIISDDIFKLPYTARFPPWSTLTMVDRPQILENIHFICLILFSVLLQMYLHSYAYKTEYYVSYGGKIHMLWYGSEYHS